MATPAVDRDALVELLDGNPDVIATLIDSFLDDCSDYMDAIRAAVESEDAEVLEREAHGLKGATGSLRASPSSEAAQTLEEMAHAGDFADAEAALETLEAEIDRLKDELRALRDCL
ncbi:Hpt domain-containing protein [Salinibacter ruber]|uniref:Hpt domain-containing protein n=1 Tax=Salinibacter ruber TaxID=146919 RepID=UPI0020740BD6|nr:Hpt domain-containing protein [Salinibacter ruber]